MHFSLTNSNKEQVWNTASFTLNISRSEYFQKNEQFQNNEATITLKTSRSEYFQYKFWNEVSLSKDQFGKLLTVQSSAVY